MSVLIIDRVDGILWQRVSCIYLCLAGLLFVDIALADMALADQRMKPSLDDSRLFMSVSERLTIDRTAFDDEVKDPLKNDIAEKSYTPGPHTRNRRTRTIALDGVVVRPDGKMIVWTENKKSAIQSATNQVQQQSPLRPVAPNGAFNISTTVGNIELQVGTKVVVEIHD